MSQEEAHTLGHTHRYHVCFDIVLTLPDYDGWFDRAMTFSCPCGVVQALTGSFNTHTPPVRYEDLLKTWLQERREGTTLAHVAQRENALRRRQRDFEALRQAV